MRGTHILVVAWCFPPFTGGGVYRPLNFVRHLSRRGARLSVLTGRFHRDDPQDPSLLDRVPPGVRVIRCRHLDPFRLYARLKKALGRAAPPAEAPAPQPVAAAAGAGPAPVRLKDLISESAALPDRWRSWVQPAALRAATALAGDPPDLVFSTAPPHSIHLVARELRALLHCPLVIDFRDPWVENPFRRYSAPLLEELDRRLERGVVGEAAQIVLNTPALEQRFRRRYPERDSFRTITNGYDPEQFQSLPIPAPRPAGGPLEIVHVGHLYGLRSGRYLVQGLQRLKERAPEDLEKVKVRLVGRIDGEAGLVAEIERLGLGDALILEGPCTHREALARQLGADVLLILGVESEGPEVQVPSKLYEYFAAARPVLSLSRRGGAIADLLERSGVPYERSEPDAPEDIADALQRLVGRAGSGGLPAVDKSCAEQFRYDRLTDKLVECFEAALAGGSKGS